MLRETKRTEEGPGEQRASELWTSIHIYIHTRHIIYNVHRVFYLYNLYDIYMYIYEYI